jgi:hypothetical protein
VMAHDLRRGRRRAVSSGRLGGGHGGAAAYPGSGEGDGGVERSDKRGRKRSGGFEHGLSGWRMRRGEQSGCRGSAVGSGTCCRGGGGGGGRKRTRRVRTAPLRRGA